MGLSTKQVSGDGLDWGHSLWQSGRVLELPKPPPATVMRRQQQQQPEPLSCPRCGSTNTKFCYYNNYNKSQPRYFCKACKRHWTKGGTLRNVPVGGGRKNKRLKTSNTIAAAISSSTTTCSTSRKTTQKGIQNQQQCQSLPLALGDQKNISEIIYQALLRPPASSHHDSINGNFLGSALPLIQNQTTPFTFFSSLSSFESNPSLIPTTSFRSSDGYDFTGGLDSMEDTTITTIMPTTTDIASQPWQVLPTTSSVMDMPNYWNWDDIDTLVSTHELNIPWDDDPPDIKP